MRKLLFIGLCAAFFAGICTVAVARDYGKTRESIMGGMNPTAESQETFAEKEMPMCPMCGPMMRSMMCKSVLSTKDGGIAVMTCGKLMKFDKDLMLAKEVEVKINLDEIQTKMKQMMEKCTMCKMPKPGSETRVGMMSRQKMMEMCCPMHRMMCCDIMNCTLLATEDDGIVVTAGDKMIKYDRDLTLVKEATIPIDLEAMQEKMKQMAKQCPMCSMMMPKEKDIIDTASAGGFTTLATALNAAGLVDTLKGTGPFTVFAPTDEAFARLAPGTLDDLLKPENKDKLANILKYHVVSGKFMAADVAKMVSAEAANGQTLKIMDMNGKVMIDDAMVTKTDIACSNGVIHVIDKVLMPK